MRNQFAKTLIDIAHEDPRIWLLTGDLGYTVLEPFAQAFPDRYVNVGVAEQNLAGIAAGLALCGKMPFIYSIANFPLLRCLEQVRNDIAYHALPVRIVSVGGGVAYGSAGYTHHGVEDLAIARAIVGMHVLAPGDPMETKMCTRALVQHIHAPAFLRLGKGGDPVLHDSEPPFNAGMPIVLREGSDVCLVATGAILAQAMQAATILETYSISARVVSVPCLSPLNTQGIMQAIAPHQHVWLLEEHMGSSPFGELYEKQQHMLLERNIRLHRLNLPDSLREVIGSRDYLLAQAGRDGKGIASAVAHEYSAANLVNKPLPR